MLPGFEILDHTADIGLRVWGRSRKEVLEEAAFGMASILCDVRRVRRAEKRIISVEGSDQEELLLNWLREVLFFFEKGFLFSGFTIMEDHFPHSGPDPFRMVACIEGEPIDMSRHDICKEIKAVTRHGLTLHRKGPFWEAQVLFDI